MIRRAFPLALLLLSLFLSSGCIIFEKVDPAKTAEAPPKPAKEETEVVYTTGSILGRKVKKGTAPTGDAQVQTADSKTMEQMQRDQTVRNMPADPAGNR